MISEGADQTVALRIRARSDVWARLNQGETTVTIDVSGITEPGEQNVTITSRNISYPRSITATDSIELQYTSPGAVTFTVSKWASKDVDVRGVFEGSIADGYQRGEFSMAPEKVTVSGPQELVEQVDYARVTVTQTDMNATYSQDTGYTLIDYDGNPIFADELETEPETVLVTLPVEKLKEVELTVDIIPGGGATADDVEIDIEPKTIMVSGSDEDLENLDSISLGEIDLADVFGSLTQSMPIQLDSVLTNVSGITEAKVTVTVKGLTTKVLQVSNISFINKPAGYQADVVTQSCSVQIRGTEEAVAAVTASQLRIVADLSAVELSTGNQTIPVKVYLDGSSDVGVVGDYNIVVSITRE
ncbi:CdaR family protein [Flavonifractor sp. HCP28S3_F3]|uniref:CdaR family protein n=1 Tax=Flavonifractor sp. HCP28S3_F3 TaxID=3438939 RepID=UPI003F8C2142